MIKRKNNGQFAKGSKPVAGFKKGEHLGKDHPGWKGGMPRCKCGKLLSRKDAISCHQHSFTKERIEKIKN